MKIQAKTKLDKVVTIIAFVSRYNKTYAVTVDQNGRLWDYYIEDLTVIDS